MNLIARGSKVQEKSSIKSKISKENRQVWVDYILVLGLCNLVGTVMEANAGENERMSHWRRGLIIGDIETSFHYLLPL